jgi:uncharacterized protein
MSNDNPTPHVESNSPVSVAKNVLGTPLKPCCFNPQTGFYRDGFCHTGPEDLGLHTACVVVNEPFLSYSKAQGNDLSTPHPEWNFPGLKPGDAWCVCALRWVQAYEDGMAAPLILEACHESLLEQVPLEVLKQFDAKAAKMI